MSTARKLVSLLLVFALLFQSVIVPASTSSILSFSAFDAYGVESRTSDQGDPFGYNAQHGYYKDTETNLYLCTWRYYDPDKGRWLTRDPIGYEGGINLYGYCQQNPVNFSDPSGLIAPLLVLGAIALFSIFATKPAFAPSKAVSQADIDCANKKLAGQKMEMAQWFIPVPFVGAGIKVAAKALKLAKRTKAAEGVYVLTGSAGKYIGQSSKMTSRIGRHSGKGGKFAGEQPLQELIRMPGSTKLEREVFEQYLINKARDAGVTLLNQRNPMGGRELLYQMTRPIVLKKYGLK